MSYGHSRKSRKRSRAWLALGTIAAYAAAGSTAKAAPAHTLAGRVQAGVTEARLSVQKFDIAAGPLDAAMAQFAKEAGLTVHYSIPANTVAGFTTRGVTGLYSRREALRQILAETGLDFRFPAPNLVSIGVKSAQVVRVNSTIADSVGLAKIPTPLVDTPQSITAIPASVLSAEGVSTLRDTLRNAPGISLAAGEGAMQGDNLSIRGFSAQGNIFLDGMRDIGSYYRDPFDYSQVDVIEGPAGAEFGRGSTGGVVNQETKEPVPHTFAVIDAEGGTDLTRRFTADLNKPFPGFAGGTAVRLNAMAHDSGIAGRDVVTSRRYGVAPSISFGMNTPTRVTASYFHFTEDDIPDYGMPWYFGSPAPVPHHNYYGFSDHNFFRADVDMGTVSVDRTLGAHAMLHDAVRYGNYQRKWQITEPQVNNKSAGAITPQTPLSDVMVNRNQLAGQSVETSFWDQADLTLTGKLLGVRHTAVLGAEGGKETSDPIRYTYSNAVGVNTVPLTPLLNPDPSQPFSGTQSMRSVAHTTTHSFGVYLLDTIDIGSHWELSGGGRWDRFDAAYNAVNYAFNASGADVGTPASFIQPISKPTWRAAIVYKPKPNGSIYFDAGDSFDPSAENISLTAATAAVPPEQNQSYEAGTKWELNQGKLAVRGAVFRTDRLNALEPDPDDSSIDVLGGSQRVDGAEAVVQGHVTDRWELLSSYTFLHSEVVASNYYPLAVGQPLENVPENLFNLWTEYRLPHGMEIGGGGNYVGARDANSATLKPGAIMETAHGYFVANAMFKYEVTERMTFQANVNNMFNKFYIDEVHPGHAIPGARASALFGLNYRF